jgi:hypothetical protein
MTVLKKSSMEDISCAHAVPGRVPVPVSIILVYCFSVLEESEKRNLSSCSSPLQTFVGL